MTRNGTVVAGSDNKNTTETLQDKHPSTQLKLYFTQIFLIITIYEYLIISLLKWGKE